MLSNKSMYRMSAPPCQSKVRGFLGHHLTLVALLPALIGDFNR
jgi:hypothetical protein